MRPVTTWSTAVSNGPTALALDGDGVVVTTNLGDVLAFDRSGRAQWRVQAGTGLAPPVIAGDSVVVADDASVTALERGDGRTRWTQPAHDLSYRVAAGAGVVVLVDRSDSVRAFDLATGAPRWQLTPPGAVYHAPVVDEAGASVVLVVPAVPGPVVRAVDAGTGAVRWERPVDRFTAVPVVADGRVYVAEGDGRHHAVVIALDLGTGERQWATQVPASFESGIVPAADPRGLVVVDHHGTVTILDPASGRVRWERRLGSTVLQTRIGLTGRRVVLTTEDRDVVVLDRANGRVVRRIAGDGPGGWAVDAGIAPPVADPGLVMAVRAGTREGVVRRPLP
jgi:outer membrane protein assembly factor BamB